MQLFWSTPPPPPHIREQEASGSRHCIYIPGASKTEVVSGGMSRGHSTSLPIPPPRSLRPPTMKLHKVPWEPCKTPLSLVFSFYSALRIRLCLPRCSGENNVRANINVPHRPLQKVYCFRYACGGREEMVCRNSIPWVFSLRRPIKAGQHQIGLISPSSIGCASRVDHEVFSLPLKVSFKYNNCLFN